MSRDGGLNLDVLTRTIFELPRKLGRVVRWQRWYDAGTEREDVLQHTFTQAFITILLAEKLKNKGELSDTEAYNALACTILHDIGESVTGDVLDYKKTASDDEEERRVVDRIFTECDTDLYHRLWQLFDVQSGAKDDATVNAQSREALLFGLAEKLCYLGYAGRQINTPCLRATCADLLEHVLARQISGTRSRLHELDLTPEDVAVVEDLERKHSQLLSVHGENMCLEDKMCDYRSEDTLSIIGAKGILSDQDIKNAILNKHLTIEIKNPTSEQRGVTKVKPESLETEIINIRRDFADLLTQCCDQAHSMSQKTRRYIRQYVHNNITPSGIDLTFDSLARPFSLGRSEYLKEEPVDEQEPSKGLKYTISSGDTISVFSRESIGLSPQLCGLVQAKVSNVSIGLSHISTTVDPHWEGVLLLTFTNHSNKGITLRHGDELATLTLHATMTPSRKSGEPMEGRNDSISSDYDNEARRKRKENHWVAGIFWGFFAIIASLDLYLIYGITNGLSHFPYTGAEAGGIEEALSMMVSLLLVHILITRYAAKLDNAVRIILTSMFPGS